MLFMFIKSYEVGRRLEEASSNLRGDNIKDEKAKKKVKNKIHLSISKYNF